jgi:hypothetical protein
MLQEVMGALGLKDTQSLLPTDGLIPWTGGRLSLMSLSALSLRRPLPHPSKLGRSTE